MKRTKRKLELTIIGARFELQVGCISLQGPVTADGFGELCKAFASNTVTMDDLNKFFRCQTNGVFGKVVK